MRRSRALRLVRLAGLAVLAATTSGCWLQQAFGPERQGYNGGETAVTAANVADLETRWTASVGGPAREAVIFQGRAYVPGSGGLTALLLATGAEQWTGPVVEGPAVVDGRLRAATGGDTGCQMRTIDPATGASTVLAPLGPELPPFLGGCSPGAVLAVGSQAIAPWSVFAGPVPGGPPGPCNRGQSFLLAGPGVTSVDVATTETWAHDESDGFCITAGGPLPSIPTIGPLSSDGDVVLFPRDRTLNALPLDCAAAGCPVAWSVDLGPGAAIVGPPVVLGSGDVALATAGGQVLVVDGTSHQVEWTAAVGGALDQPLAASPTTIFATGTDGTVAAFPAAGCGAGVPTCDPAWTATLASPASARPSIGGDVLYVGSADGTVSALPAAGCGTPTCTTLWTGATGSRITGAPAIFSGTVVVGSQSGTVTAFALPATS